MLAKYDTNKDGKLDDSEKKAMREGWEKRREEFKKQMLEKYDKNKDGKLDDDEKKAAREAFIQRMKERHKDRD